MSKDEISRRLHAISMQLVLGCGNYGCRIFKPKGQATNASCGCSRKLIARELIDLSEEIDYLDINWIERQTNED